MDIDFGRYLKEKRLKKGYTINQLALYSGMSSAQLSRIENGKRGVPKAENIQKIASALSVPHEEMMEVAGYLEAKQENGEDNWNSVLPELTAKDERDITADLEKMINNLDSKGGYAAFDGHSMDEMEDEDREILKASLENSLRLAKRMAKQKFTPKKYRD